MRLDNQRKADEIRSRFIAAQGEGKAVDKLASQWENAAGRETNDQAAFDAKFGGGI